MSAIYWQLQKCEMNEENKLPINVGREFCFKDFQKTFQENGRENASRECVINSITFIGESGIDTEGVFRKFYSGFVRIFHFFSFFLS